MPPSIFRRNQAPQPVIAEEVGLGLPEVQAGLSPDDFIARHAESLTTSRNVWGKIHESVGAWRTEEVVEGMSVGVTNNLRAGGNQNPNPDDVREIATNLTDDLSVLWLLAARHEASLPGRNAVKRTTDAMVYINMPPSQGVKHVLSILSRRTRLSIMSNFAKAQATIEHADNHSDHVMRHLAVHTFADRDLLRTYRDRLAVRPETLDEDAAELRKMITVDWHNGDPQKSVLRSYLSDLRQNPESLVIPFIEKIVDEPTNREQEGVRHMANFAIMALHREPTGDALKKVLHDTHTDWENDDYLSTTFKKFVADKITETESLMAEIAGRRDPKEIRMHRTVADIYELFSTVQERRNVTREVRRAARKRTGKVATYDSPDLPNTVDIERQLIAAAPPANRPIRLVRKAMSGHALGEVQEAEQIAEHLISNNFPGHESDSQLRQDINTILTHLRDVPNLSARGFKKLDQGNRINVGSGVIPLWRFAPNDAPGVRVSSKNRFLRAVCAFKDGEMLLVDLLTHADFDSKY